MAAKSSPPRTAREICEAILRAERSDRVQKAILPSEIKVIDRLLDRGLELNDAYEELFNKLHDHPPALKVFFELLQSTATFWSPKKNLEARKDRDKLIEVNRKIAENAMRWTLKTGMALLLEKELPKTGRRLLLEAEPLLLLAK